MDKTTKSFIIAACGVIIATPLVHLAFYVIQKVHQQNQINLARQAAEKEAIAKAKVAAADYRAANRMQSCNRRVKLRWPDLDENGEYILYNSEESRRYSEWRTKCWRSTLPVDQLEFPRAN